MLPLFSELLESSEKAMLLKLQQFLVDELSDDFEVKLQSNGVLVTCKVENPSGKVGVNIPQPTLFVPWRSNIGAPYDLTFEKVGIVRDGKISPRMYFSYRVLERMNQDAKSATHIMDRYK